MDLREYALTIMREQIQQQFESRVSLDNKASWLLGFLAIVFTIFFSTQKSKVDHCWLVAIGILLLISFVLSVVSLLVPFTLSMSPGIEPFRKFVEENVDDSNATATLAQLLSEDHVGDFRCNRIKLIIKQSILSSGYLFLLASLIIMAFKAR